MSVLIFWFYMCSFLHNLSKHVFCWQQNTGAVTVGGKSILFKLICFVCPGRKLAQACFFFHARGLDNHCVSHCIPLTQFIYACLLLATEHRGRNGGWQIVLCPGHTFVQACFWYKRIVLCPGHKFVQACFWYKRPWQSLRVPGPIFTIGRMQNL